MASGLTDGGDVSVVEVVFCKANDQTSLAHPRVPDQQQLEEVVVGFGHGGHWGSRGRGGEAPGTGGRDWRAGEQRASGSLGQEVFLAPRPGSGKERRPASGPHPLPAPTPRAGRPGQPAFRPPSAQAQAGLPPASCPTACCCDHRPPPLTSFFQSEARGWSEGK